jgi:hypothetical protein
MDMDIEYLVGRIRAYCERFHPNETRVYFRDFHFGFYPLDGSVLVGRDLPPATTCILLEIDCDGAVRYHNSEEVLYGELLPLLEKALVLDELADV